MISKPTTTAGTQSGNTHIKTKVYIIALIFILASLLTGQVQAASTNNFTSDAQTILEIAGQLNTSVQSKTVLNIENYVRSTFKYEFHWYPQDINKTWETKTGDCTDRSMVIVEMLKENGFEDAKTVHGYVYDEEGKRVKHDWVEVAIRVDGTGDFENYEKIGNGVW
jgi:transglutaminase-like putative cysteine protease